MNSNLFAFRVARPIEGSSETPLEFTYDPQSQTSVWNGNGAAVASLFCTSTSSGRSFCNAYGNYCTTGGGGGRWKCD